PVHRCNHHAPRRREGRSKHLDILRAASRGVVCAMNTPGYASIFVNGLWTSNPGLVQLLGLCPLLAVSGTVVNALGLGIATTLVLLGSNLIVSLIRNHVANEVRIPVFVLVIASLVTTVELVMNAFFHDL